MHVFFLVRSPRRGSAARRLSVGGAVRCHPHPMLLSFVVRAELNLGYAKPLCVVSWVVPLLLYIYVKQCSMRVADGERLRCLEISYGRTRVVVVPVVALVFTEVEVCVSEVVCCFRCSSVTGEQVSQRGHTLFPLVQVVRAAVGSRLQYRQRQTNALEVQ